MRTFLFRGYQLIIGFVSLLYISLAFVSFSMSLLTVMAVDSGPLNSEQITTTFVVVLGALYTLPFVSLGAVLGSWYLYKHKQYVFSLVPLLLPLINVSTILCLINAAN